MDSIQLKIMINRMKFGDVFIIVDDLLHTFNLYNLKYVPGTYIMTYVDLCESFFININFNLNHQNYILDLQKDNYSYFVRSCFDRSRPLKDVDQYPVKVEAYSNFLEKLNGFMCIYFEQYKTHIINQKSMGSNVSALKESKIKIVNSHELENRFVDFQKHRLQRSQLTQSNKTIKSHVLIPQVKMQPIYPRPPQIDNEGQIIIPKNYLDINYD